MSAPNAPDAARAADHRLLAGLTGMAAFDLDICFRMADVAAALRQTPLTDESLLQILSALPVSVSAAALFHVMRAYDIQPWEQDFRTVYRELDRLAATAEDPRQRQQRLQLQRQQREEEEEEKLARRAQEEAEEAEIEAEDALM